MKKIEEKINDFKITIIAEIREQIKQEFWEALEKEIKKRIVPQGSIFDQLMIFISSRL